MWQPHSIRNRILFWFYLLLSLMMVFSAITYSSVSKVKKKLSYIETVDLFMEDTLEMRRMEKNFFLYRDQDSIKQWGTYLQKLTRQIEENNKLFIKLSSSSEISKVRHTLNDYKNSFTKFNIAQSNEELMTQLRQQGNHLTLLVEKLIVQEHQTIHRLLDLVYNSLLILLPALILIFSFIFVTLGKGIVFSLKKLEEHASEIAKGHFEEMPFVPCTNKEIKCLFNAFNQMSRELKIRQQQLVRAEKLASLGTMLAGVAHEFNNPLSNISSSTQILAEELDDRDSFSHELVKQISTETSRAAAIVNTLLSLAREEKFHREHYPLKPLFVELLALLRGQLSKDIDIQLAIDDGITAFVDKQKIQQVFINLLQNSSDAIHDRGLIRIKAWQNPENLKIVFTDNGPGIPQQIHRKIFDPFFTTKDTGEGSGLGLFIVHDIIIQHNGHINIDRTDKGTVFTISLPTKE